MVICWLFDGYLMVFWWLFDGYVLVIWWLHHMVTSHCCCSISSKLFQKTATSWLPVVANVGSNLGPPGHLQEGFTIGLQRFGTRLIWGLASRVSVRTRPGPRLGKSFSDWNHPFWGIDKLGPMYIYIYAYVYYIYIYIYSNLRDHTISKCNKKWEFTSASWESSKQTCGFGC